MKNILVLTASPRQKGNSNTMAKAFKEEINALGYNLKTIDVNTLNIGGCKACNACYCMDDACAQEPGGDFNKVAPEILKADGILFAMPTYWYSIPAKMKALIDKFYAFMVGERRYQGKTFGVITCCEEDDPHVMDGVTGPLERTGALLKWKCAGMVRVPSVAKPGDVEKTDGCEQAKALARNF